MGPPHAGCTAVSFSAGVKSESDQRKRSLRTKEMPFAQVRELPAARFFFVCASMIPALAGCSRHHVQVPAGGPASPAANNSYMDLEAGWRLRIVVPVTASGGERVETGARESQGNTIVLSAPNLIGYEVSYYTIEGHRKGKVRLKFASAEMTKSGKTVAEPEPPRLSFSLPNGTKFVRLVYLVRASRADHNMAIAAAKSKAALTALTAELRENPSACESRGDVFCAWVPAGVAVRPEQLTPAKRSAASPA
jgi:hypothetical protein